MLSGILATVVRNILKTPFCDAPAACRPTSEFADAVVAGDLPQAVANIAPLRWTEAIEHAHKAYSTGFSSALMTASLIAFISAAVVYRLMRGHQGQTRW